MNEYHDARPPLKKEEISFSKAPKAKKEMLKKDLRN